MNMKTARLDFNGCKTISDLHKKIKKTLNFPEHYGENLNALWDCLCMDCDKEFVTVVGIENIPKALKSTADAIINVFEEVKKETQNSNLPFDYEII